MLCPRCQKEAEEGTRLCSGCGAPLALRPEPAPASLDRSLRLDRRTRLEACELVLEGGGGGHAVSPEAHSLPLRAPSPPELARPAPMKGKGRPEERAPSQPPAPPGGGIEQGGAPAEAALEVTVAPVEIHLRRASDWKRAASWAIDALPFVALLALSVKAVLDALPHAGALDLAGYADLAGTELTGVIAPILAAVSILFLVYQTLAHALSGATLGKRILGLRVVGSDGRRPGLGRSGARALLAAVSVLLLGLGVLLALFTRSGRALHDLAARTWVVEAS